jgi:peptide chain release factor 1
MKFNLDNLVVEYTKLEEELANPEVFKDQKKVKEVSMKKKQLEESVVLYKEYKKINGALDEAVEMINSSDLEMRELALMQKEESENKIADLEEKLKLALLPKDPNDEKNIIVEIRA